MACIGILYGNSYHLSLGGGGGSSAQDNEPSPRLCGTSRIVGRQNNNGMDRERARGATMDREHQEVAAPPWRPASLVLRRPAYIVRRRIRAAGHLKLRAGPAALPQAAAVRDRSASVLFPSGSLKGLGRPVGRDPRPCHGRPWFEIQATSGPFPLGRLRRT